MRQTAGRFDDEPQALLDTGGGRLTCGKGAIRKLLEVRGGQQGGGNGREEKLA